MFRGSMVAIVTPFDSQGRFDEETYRQLIEFQLENGTDVIVPCGTTGESATLDFDEHDHVIKVCIEQVNKRVPVMAGTGANTTHEAIELSLEAKKMGWPTVCCWSAPTTTSRPRKGSTTTTRSWPRPSPCRRSSTTSPGAPASTCCRDHRAPGRDPQHRRHQGGHR